MERAVLNAQIREKTGKSVAKKLRREGGIPAVVYAKKEKPIHVVTNRREFIKLLHKQGENAIIDLSVEKDNKFIKRTVIIKEIQYDTIKEGVFHVDFQQIKLTEKIRVHVPLISRGDADAPGVKEGGTLEHILREVEVECLPTNIPKEIIIDVSSLKIGDTVCARDLKIDEKITLVTDPAQMLVLIKFEAKAEVEEEKVEEEVTAEPEVIKKGKAEEGETEEPEK